MALLNMFKKKAKEPSEMDLPPPPEELPELPLEEIPPIRAGKAKPGPKQMPAELPVPEEESMPAPAEHVPEEELMPAPAELLEMPEEAVIEPGPVFINVADYKDIINGVEKIRSTLADSEEIIAKLNDLKNAEDKVFENWRLSVEDIERKLTYIDQVIFRGE